MSKRAFDQRSILNSANIQNTTCESLRVAIERTWMFCFRHPGNPRSSAKTDFLHNAVLNILRQAFGDHQKAFDSAFTLDIETNAGVGGKTKRQYVKDGLGKKDFPVDGLIRWADSFDPQTVFLIKAPLTSVNKNGNNSLLNNFGEIMRFYTRTLNRGTHLVFINIIPEQTFVPGKKWATEVTNHLALEDLVDDEVMGLRSLREALPIDAELKPMISEIVIKYNLSFPHCDFQSIKSHADLRRELATCEASQGKEEFVQVQAGAVKNVIDYVERFMATSGLAAAGTLSRTFAGIRPATVKPPMPTGGAHRAIGPGESHAQLPLLL